MTTFFSKADLEHLAGSDTYTRGERSVSAVDGVTTSGTEVTATVYGTEPWRVRLNRRPAGLDGSCDCPQGMAGEFCRHCVAVGIVCLDGPAPGSPSEEVQEAQKTVAGLRRLMSVLDREDLTELLLAGAATDHDLRRHLAARVDDMTGGGTAVNAAELRLADVRALTDPEAAIGVYKRHIESLIMRNNRFDYAEAARYVQHLRAAYARLNREPEALVYAGKLRSDHARKRNLLDELTKCGV
jgi:uncharacterized Zn finger protein